MIYWILYSGQKELWYVWTSINTRVNQKFCNILVMLETIWHLWLLLLKAWRWQTRWDCEKSSPLDTLQIHLYGIKRSLGIHDFRPTWPYLVTEVLATQIFFNRLVTVLWSTAPSSYTQQKVLVVWFGLVLWHINHWRLFNAKSIFISINSSISNNSV